MSIYIQNLPSFYDFLPSNQPDIGDEVLLWRTRLYEAKTTEQRKDFLGAAALHINSLKVDFDFLGGADDFIERVFGPAGNIFLPKVFQHITEQQKNIELFTESLWREGYVPKTPVTEATKNVLMRCQEQFHIKNIWYSLNCEDEWMKRQILDLRTGMSHLADLLPTEERFLGQQALSFYFFQHTKRPIAALFDDTITIGGRGQGLSRLWAQWIMGRSRGTAHHSFWQWAKSRPQTHFEKSQRQTFALVMAKKQFRYLVDSIDLSTEAGEKVGRRFRAFGKWVDDLERGQDLEQILAGWQKVKTGNRIAWSSGHFDHDFLKSWQVHEKDIEEAFWKSPRWDVPAWMRRSWSDDPQSKNIEGFVGCGFEAWIRHKMGYDSCLARDCDDHPVDKESEEFFSFFSEILLKEILE